MSWYICQRCGPLPNTVLHSKGRIIVVHFVVAGRNAKKTYHGTWNRIPVYEVGNSWFLPLIFRVCVFFFSSTNCTLTQLDSDPLPHPLFSITPKMQYLFDKYQIFLTNIRLTYLLGSIVHSFSCLIFFFIMIYIGGQVHLPPLRRYGVPSDPFP